MSGTNYAVEFVAEYECININETTQYTLGTFTEVPLRSTVYVPLQDAALNTIEEVYYGPVIRDIWFSDTPEVIVIATEEESAPEEASPEEAPAPETAAAAPEDSGVTLLSPGTGLNSDTTSLTFSPSASSSPATGSSPEVEPEPVSGFDTAAQNQSLIAG